MQPKRRSLKVFEAVLISLSLAACASKDAQPTADAKIIGGASMDTDRMVTVMLRAEGEHGTVGDTAFFMKPDHKDYEKTIQHVGGLKPGQMKPYPACPPSAN